MIGDQAVTGEPDTSEEYTCWAPAVEPCNYFAFMVQYLHHRDVTHIFQSFLEGTL